MSCQLLQTFPSITTNLFHSKQYFFTGLSYPPYPYRPIDTCTLRYLNTSQFLLIIPPIKIYSISAVRIIDAQRTQSREISIYLKKFRLETKESKKNGTENSESWNEIETKLIIIIKQYFFTRLSYPSYPYRSISSIPVYYDTSTSHFLLIIPPIKILTLSRS